MKKYFLAVLLLSYGCSQVSKPRAEINKDEVSVETALNQAQSSYLLGCVEAFKTAKLNPSFPECRNRAIKHRVEIEELLRQVPISIPVSKPL
jgi:hypothetical protein